MVYQPLINKVLWLKIVLGIFLLLTGAVLLRNYFPVDNYPDLLSFFYQIDFSWMLKPFHLLSATLSSISLKFVAGMAAIALLLFVDQLYVRITDRQT